MRDLGEYPMAFKSDSSDCRILVEIYKIDHHILHQLDMLEGYREDDEGSLYQRDTVSCESGIKGFLLW